MGAVFMKLSRDEFRNLKSFSREQMEKWLQGYYNVTYNSLRKEFNDAYKDELDSSVQNFITAIAYTLHYNEDVHLQHDELNSFMEDLFVSVEMFRKGEYRPEVWPDPQFCQKGGASGQCAGCIPVCGVLSGSAF